MPTLVLHRGSDPAIHRRLTADRTTLGSADWEQKVDLQISAPGVAPVHAWIVREGMRYALVDRSEGGSWVGGEPVRGRVSLWDGAEIRLGEAHLVFREDDDADAGPETERDALAGEAPALPEKLWIVAEEWDPDGSLRQRLPLRSTVTIGTAASNGLRLRDARASREHAEVSREGGVLVYRDLRSRNGSFCNGLPVVEIRLPLDVRVQIGSSRIWVTAQEEGAAPRAEEFEGLYTEMPELGELFREIERMARSQSPVIVHGESGTGKELVARALHRRSLRSAGPFVPLNCSTLKGETVRSELFGHVKGAFTGADRAHAGAVAEASGGTLFLDEIGDLPAEVQAMLLRLLQERRYRQVGGSGEHPADVRIVAASHASLEEAVAAGRFREDLFFRLAVLGLHVPPLRARQADVLPLFERFLREEDPGAKGRPVGEDARRALLAHPWPGNVRELRNAASRAVALSDEGAVIGARDLRLGPPRSPVRREDPDLVRPFGKTLEEAERAIYEIHRRRLGHDVPAIARALGLSLPTVRKKLRAFGLG